MVIGKGSPDRLLASDEIEAIAVEALTRLDLAGKRVLIIIPDTTRTAPIPHFFRLFARILSDVEKLDFLVALGTHPPLPVESLNSLVGITAAERKDHFGHIGIFNHEWQHTSTFTTLGVISASEVASIVGDVLTDLPHDAGLLRDIPVTLNRKIHEYDHVIICGPTFPHEVVGFSGGNKYFFPGVSGPEVINYSHWLGAVLSSFRVIGTVSTPVRQVIDRAAAMIDRPKSCFSMVVKGEGLAGLYAGTPEEAYLAATQLSSQIHVKWLDRPVRQVLSIMPQMYDDIWTAAKGMYKMEPAVEDGGEVIIYAPHIDEVSYTHGKFLDEVGYHVADYFLKQWDRFGHYPGSVLAHSTHVRGLGTFDATTGIESPRVQVTLATRIPRERCERVGLGYADYRTIDPKRWQQEGQNRLCVPKAGEILYRLKSQREVEG